MDFFLLLQILSHASAYLIIIIIMVIFNNNDVNIELGKTNRLKALCMMQIKKMK